MRDKFTSFYENNQIKCSRLKNDNELKIRRSNVPASARTIDHNNPVSKTNVSALIWIIDQQGYRISRSNVPSAVRTINPYDLGI
jgi:hypothetical protein